MKKKKTKIHLLVIGGTGFIGHNILKKAKMLNWNLSSASRRKPKKSKIIKGVHYMKVDITNKSQIKKRLNQNFTHVINAAGNASENFKENNKKKIFQLYHLRPKNLIDFFLKKKIQNFIQIGSSAEYGPLKAPQSENNKCYPKSDYGIAKLKTTEHISKLYDKKKFPSTVIRLFQVYGHEQDHQSILQFIIKNCLKNKSFDLSKGNQTRDFCFIDDVIRAIFLLIKSKKKGEIFNVAQGVSISIKKLTNMIKNKLKKGKPNFGKIKYKKNEIIHSRANIKKINKKIKWKPKIKIDEGINLLLNYEQ